MREVVLALLEQLVVGVEELRLDSFREVLLHDLVAFVEQECAQKARRCEIAARRPGDQVGGELQRDELIVGHIAAHRLNDPIPISESVHM